MRVRNKSRVLGGSLGRTFSRSCGGLAGPPALNRDFMSQEARRSSIRVSTNISLLKTNIPMRMKSDYK